MLAVLIAAAVTFADPLPPDSLHGPFDELLKRHVHGRAVDYFGLSRDRAKLEAYFVSLAGIDASRMSRVERMSLFINAYNAATLLLVVERLVPGLASIRDVPESKRWKDPRWRIAGKTYSLDDIEHKVLRPEFGDARVHAAINCASKGCPALRGEAFDARRIEEQLDEQSRRFVNDPGHVRVENGTLHVSQIFEWFADDFASGSRSIVGFIKKHADEDLRKQIDTLSENPKIAYISYDWSLNGVEGKSPDK